MKFDTVWPTLSRTAPSTKVCETPLSIYHYEMCEAAHCEHPKQAKSNTTQPQLDGDPEKRSDCLMLMGIMRQALASSTKGTRLC